MPKVISLRTRILFLLLALLSTTIGGGLATLWYSSNIGSLFSSVIDQDLLSFQTAEEMETALVMQKGFTTYYFQDGNTDWLNQLILQQKIFERKISTARSYTRDEKAWKILGKIESEYIQYKTARAEVIRLYQSGDRAAGLKLHLRIRPQFLSIVALCEQYKEIHKNNIIQIRHDIQVRTGYIGSAALLAVLFASLIGLLLGYILFRQILEPIRRLTLATQPGDTDTRSAIPNEVSALSRRVHSLIEDVDQTQSQLARSQEQMLQSEKWALTGKLAAGVAHSIRNPLTSVKIRLFSMGRTPGLSAAQKEDLEVISTEISHIESIVRSFLEFSRPPKLVMQKISPSEVVDMTLRLLKPRLESNSVQVVLEREKNLPELMADPDQLKEVMVNLLVNACDVMIKGGLIRIEEKEEIDGKGKRAARVAFSDNGPGIPESIQENIFQPFFSTKEEGTGLGLSIASRIVENHGGKLSLCSQEGQGTTFFITLPYPEDEKSLEKKG
ncbi:MAG: ATP-binding protein [Thermodesulfobacteriota bacterium]